MPPLSILLRRLLRNLMFWLAVGVLALAVLRSFHPRDGFDEIRTGEGPVEVGASDDGLWVLNHGDRSLSLVRPSDEEILFTTALGDWVAPALSVDDDGAWVILDRGATVARVDPGGDGVDQRVDVSDAFASGADDLAVGAGAVWVTSTEDETMARVDPEEGAVGEVVDLDRAVAQPQIHDDVLWVNQGVGLGAYDVDTGELIRLVETDHDIGDFVVDERAIWLLADVDNFEATGLVVRVDPVSGAEDARARVTAARPARLVVEGEQLFVSGSDGTLIELSTQPLAMVASEQVAVSTKNLRGLVVLEDVVWVADGTNGVAHQPVDGIDDEVVTEEDDELGWSGPRR